MVLKKKLIEVISNPKRMFHFINSNVSRILALLISKTTKKTSVSVADSNSLFYVDDIHHYNSVRLFDGERPVLEEVLDIVQEDDTFYDIGSQLGIYSCMVGGKPDEVDVIACEPFDEHAKLTEKNIQLNDLPGEVFQYALWDDQGTAKFGSDEEKTGTRIVEVDGNVVSEKNSQKELVDLIDGDLLIQREDLAPPDVMKIDVEGAEVRVLRGLRETLSQNGPRAIFLELHHSNDGELRSARDYNDDPDDVFELLSEFGYTISELPTDTREGVTHIKATK